MTRREAAGWGLALLLCWLVAYPLVLVLLGAIRDAAGWTLEPIRRFGAERQEWTALRGSLVISLASVALAGAIGVPLAFLLGRREFPGRRLLSALVALPAVLPPLVGVLAFLFLFGERGFLAHLVTAVTGAPRRPGGWRGPGPSCWSTAIPSTSTSTSSPSRDLRGSTARSSRPPPPWAPRAPASWAGSCSPRSGRRSPARRCSPS